MKRLIIVIFSLAFLFIAITANANGWGLTGELLEAVSSVHTWDDYSAKDGQVNNMAIMSSRYHNALFYLDENLNVYTKAVYQHDEDKADKVKLKGNDNQITISYSDNEWYKFNYDDNNWILKEAKYGQFSVKGEPYAYETIDNTGKAIWNNSITLSNFNINLFPHSVEEVKHYNYINAALDSGKIILIEWGEGSEYAYIDGINTNTKLAVYSSPYGKSAWRAAKGKAAVSLKGGLWLMSLNINNDNGSYTLVRYDVSQRTQRIGFVDTKEIVKLAKIGDENSNELINVDVIAKNDTYLTDDPDVSRYRQFIVPKGTQLNCMALYNNEYAYVSAEVKGDSFVDGGAIVWGFVPVRDLDIMDRNILADDYEDDDVANKINKTWLFNAGGSMAEEAIKFNLDGTYLSGHIDENKNMFFVESKGIWRIREYKEKENLYWNDPKYELTLINNNGTVNIKGLDLSDGGLNLTYWEGGGGYIPYTEPLEYIDEDIVSLGNG